MRDGKSLLIFMAKKPDMMDIRRATPLDLTLMIFTMAVWGMAFVAMKVVVPETGPFWLATGRTGFGFLVVLPFLFWAGLKIPKDGMQWIYIALVVVLNTTVPIILISWAELTLNAGIAALLLGVGPFLALFIGQFVTTDEPFTLVRLLAVLMGFAGIISVVGFDAFYELNSDQSLAEGALILAALMYVIAGFTVRRIDLPPLSLAGWSLALGTIALVPISLILSGPMPTRISSEAFWWLAFVGIFGTGLGFVLRYHLINKIGYSMFSLGVNLITVFGVIFGALILNETVTPRIGFALLLIVGGLFIARLEVRKKG